MVLEIVLVSLPTANEYFLAQSLDTMKVFGKKRYGSSKRQKINIKICRGKTTGRAIVEGLTDSISEQDVRLGKSLNKILDVGYTQLNAFMDTEIENTKKQKKRLFAASKEILFSNHLTILYEGGGNDYKIQKYRMK